MVRRQSFELDPDSHPLAPALIAFNRGNGWYRAVLAESDGREWSARGEWIGMAELSVNVDDVDRRLTKLEAAYGGHAGYAAASLIQQAAHPLVSLTAWCVLLGPWMPDIAPTEVWLRQHPHGLFDRIALGGNQADPNTDQDQATTVGSQIVGSLSPLLDSIRSVRKAGLAGLWHGVSDLVARTFLGAASSLGSIETGVVAAEAILTRAPTEIRSTPRWHTNQATGMWFSLRSVCCLAYTGTSGIYCDTCPLLEDDEITRRLASNHAGAL
jgi:hypothetical protein